MRKFLVLLIITYSHVVMSQVQSLDSCISFAFNHHPILKSKEKQIVRIQLESKAVFNPEPLQINYVNGNINSGMVDYAVDVSQTFDFPTEYILQKKLKKNEVELSQSELLIQKATLRKEIKSAYNTLLLSKNKLLLLERFSSHLNKFEKVAQSHNELDSLKSSLEYTSAKARHQELLVSIEQEKLNIEQFMNILRSWTSNTKLSDIKDSILIKSSMMRVKKTNTAPYEKIQNANIEVSKNESRVQKAALTPDISLGYFNQQIDGIGNFDGVMIGTSIPLFFGGQAKIIKASQVEIERQELELNAIQLSVNFQRKNLIIELKKFDNLIHFFENQGGAFSEDLLDKVDELFEKGEIDYVEYLRDIDQAIQLKSSYLENLYNYNEAWYELELLQTERID